MALATTITTDDETKQEKLVQVSFFHIDMIPGAMDNMGWTTAAKLMRHWFSQSPAYAFTEETRGVFMEKLDARLIPESQTNTDIVTMAWACKFHQVTNGIEELKREWMNEKGLAQLKKRLLKMNNQGNEYAGNIRLGYSEEVKYLDDTAQVNFRKVGSRLDELNDWYGAMGESNLKVCVRGYTSTVNSKAVFIAESIGFYLKDSYDFVDGITPEMLGVWSKRGVLNKSETAAYMSLYLPPVSPMVLVMRFFGFVPVFNSDFRRWQKKHNTGGDFIIFSDVLWLQPQEKDRVICL